MNRCNWVTKDILHQQYHDEEWGKVLTDSKYLFQALMLESMQSGLSWLTVLKKREAMKLAFSNFSPEKLIEFTELDIQRLKVNSSIIRHEGKIRAIIKNAHAYLAIEQKYGSFSFFIWSFSELCDNQDESSWLATAKLLSKEMKKYGMTFVGPTTVLSFMKAVGIINAHECSCFLYKQ